MRFVMSGLFRHNEMVSEKWLGCRASFLLWLVFFAYALAISVVLQKLILPLVPGMHAGHGLMPDDAIYFHNVASGIAENIRQYGWGSWKLVPSAEATGNVGLLSAVYALFGSNPVWFLPLTAGFHALGAMLLVHVALQVEPSRRGLWAGIVAALCFLAFPSALVWFGQNHKDSFVIAGFLLSLLAFTRGLNAMSARQRVLNALLFLVGLYLVYIMRRHLIMIYLAAFLAALLLLLVLGIFFSSWRANGPLVYLASLLVLGSIFLSFPFSNQDGLVAQNGFVERGGILLDGWQWHASGVLPGSVEHLIEKVSSIRVHFINYGISVEAGSIIDPSVRPQTVGEFLAYLPRAAVVGLFAPFPDFWVERLSLPRVIGAMETLVFYLSFPGVVYLLVRRCSKALLVCLSVAGLVLLVQAFVSPNLGTLHRVRYGQWMVWLAIGVCGWAVLLDSLLRWADRRRQAVSQVGSGESAPLASGRKAAGAGFVVSLVSLLGFLGLLVRDLILIDRVGFGGALDGYYLAMMPPMFFVALLVTPLGDALSNRIVQLSGRDELRSLLRAVSASALLLFAAIALAMLTFADGLLSLFADGRSVESGLELFPVALFLLVFSGLTAVGNSLINSLGRPVLAAAAQLIVPVLAVAAVLLADSERILMAAILGMVVGQLLNLVLLALLVWRQRYTLMPGSLRPLKSERDMLVNFKWLALCALLTGAVVPVNYWFAGGLGEGLLSVWGIGSKLVQIASLLGAALMTAVFLPYISRIVLRENKSRIRDDMYLSLLVGGWGCCVAALGIFVFAEPVVYALAGEQEKMGAVEQLIGVIRLGALQLPFVFTSILLFKLCAVSSASRRASLSAGAGLFINIALSFLLVPRMGLLGLALAWSLASLATTLVALFLTYRQSHLSLVDQVAICATWCVCLLAVAALHFHSADLAMLVAVTAVVVIGFQVRRVASPGERHPAESKASG